LADKSEARRLKVLFLASWYPNKEHPVSGIFVKRHAIAVSIHCDIAVLYVHLGDTENETDVNREDNLIEVRVYRKRHQYNTKWMKYFYDYAQFYFDFLRAEFIGYRIIEKEFGRPDLAHVNVILYSGLMGLALKFLRGIPYVVTEHWAGYLKEDGTFYRRSSVGKYIIRAVGNKALALMAVSCSLRDAMKACGIENRFFVIPNVVDVRSVSTDTVRHGGKKIIIHISLLKDEVKNVSGIIEAIRILKQKRSDFELHLIGDGNDRKKLEDTASNYGLLNTMIYFHGMVDADEVENFIQGSDFSIINSKFETFSVSAAESLICGKPVIATRCGGPEEFVDDKCGILVEKGDVEGLAKAMDYMLDNYGRYDSKEIAKYAKSRFSSLVVGKMIYDVYKSVLKSKPKNQTR
jgi:glycosyltransferase involved in cell wall biosynthesis